MPVPPRAWAPFPLLCALVAFAGCVASPPAEDPLEPRCPSPCAVLVDGEPWRSWEVSAAVDPTDPRHVVAGAYVYVTDPHGDIDGRLFAHVSRDGGATWESAMLPTGDDVPATHPLRKATWFADPVVAFLPDGTLLYSFLAVTETEYVAASPADVGANTGYDLFVARASDGGLRYAPEDIVRVAQGRGVRAFAASPAAPAVANALYAAHDKQWLAVDAEGRALLAWSQASLMDPQAGSFPTGARIDVRAARSEDGGRTWSEPALVARGGEHVFVSPLALPDGRWAVAYHDRATGELFLSVSEDPEGERWTQTRVAQDAYAPDLALLPAHDGPRLLLGYAEVDEDGVERPVARTSRDGGATWSAPLVLGRPSEPGRTTLAVEAGPDGAAWAAFFLPGGGETGAVSTLVTVRFRDDAVSAPVVLDAAFEGPTWSAGDYVGLAAGPAGAHVVWATHRSGEFDLLAARVHDG